MKPSDVLTMPRAMLFIFCWWMSCCQITTSFMFQQRHPNLARHSRLLCDPSSSITFGSRNHPRSTTHLQQSDCAEDIIDKDIDEKSSGGRDDGVPMNRRTAISSIIVSSSAGLIFTAADNANAEGDATSDDSFASIAARAGRISREVEAVNPSLSSEVRATDKTVYDFSLPVKGEMVPFGDIIRQEYTTQALETFGGKSINVPKVKAIIVVNIKQDDPVARKTIPELMSLAAKYGRGDAGSLAIVCSPTDQGYYEPDTSQLIRLKLESEYGYGINPSTTLTDKVILLGTGAIPFWRWLQSTSRTPAGIGRIEGNFEKFLIDGRTGLPVRRYPRKYKPTNMADDIEAIIAGKPLPPARANWLEEWRTSAAEAERDTYRFEKGLNVFDQ